MGKIKTYTPREERLNVSSHFFGVILALAGAIPLSLLAEKNNSGLFTAGLIFYWLSLLAMFGASGFYHLCRKPEIKPLARRFDHCAIYLLITGTYAPLITGAVKTFSGYMVLLVLIILTILGILGKIFFDDKFHWLEVIIYLAMGWACVFIARDLIAGMSSAGLKLLLTGGIAYTGGVAFYVVRKEFFHAIWHLFVLLGAIFQFFSILTIENI